MKRITVKEYKEFLFGKKTPNRKLIEKLLKEGGEAQYENKRRSI